MYWDKWSEINHDSVLVCFCQDNMFLKISYFRQKCDFFLRSQKNDGNGKSSLRHCRKLDLIYSILIFYYYNFYWIGEATWYKINYGPPACFQARNNRPGYVVYRGSQGMLLGALKLAYRSRHVRCVSNVAHDSRWGCHGYSSFISYPLNVVITDKYNNIIFPLNQFITHSAGLWYNMPAVDENHTDELVFSNFEYPLYLSPFMELRIWFGEDLKNWSDGITREGSALTSMVTSLAK